MPPRAPARPPSSSSATGTQPSAPITSSPATLPSPRCSASLCCWAARQAARCSPCAISAHTAASRFPLAGSMAKPCNASTTAGVSSPAAAAARRFPRSPRTTISCRKRIFANTFPVQRERRLRLGLRSRPQAQAASSIPPAASSKPPTCRPFPSCPSSAHTCPLRTPHRPTFPATSITASSASWTPRTAPSCTSAWWWRSAASIHEKTKLLRAHRRRASTAASTPVSA